VRDFGHGIKIEPFYPASTYQTFGSGVDHPLPICTDSSVEDSTISFIKSQLNLDASTVRFRNSFSSDVVHHVYFDQVYDGISFSNVAANVALNHDKKIVAFGSSFVKPKSIAPSTPTVSLDAAIKTAEDVLNGQFNNHPAKLRYLAKADGSAVLTHIIQIKNESTGAWFEAFVDAHSGELVSITDFRANASYLVLPVQRQIPAQGFGSPKDPADKVASPSG
jgi:extracellular elastinolytic metalloproteinase